MPHISALKRSNYLTRADVGRGVLVTVREIYQENVAKEGAPEEVKWIISFNELEKGMVLNPTNGQIIAKILGSENTDDWIGHQIVLYDEPNVSFGGKLVGGIRARAPRRAPTANPIPASPSSGLTAPAPRRHAPTAPAPAPAAPPQPTDNADNSADPADPGYDPEVGF